MDGLDTQAQAGGDQTETPQKNTLIGDLTGAMTFYAVYYNPTDFPGEWVVRRWVLVDLLVRAEPQLWGQGATLQEVRRLRPPETLILPKREDDDPALWEVWV